jgi:Mg2+/citrate symporter
MENIKMKSLKEKLQDIEVDLENQVYMAALVFERAEFLGLINGNGHHMAQDLAKEAVCRLHQRAIKIHPELEN